MKSNKIDISGMIKASLHNCEFYDRPTEVGVYNPTPIFFQNLVNENKVEALPEVTLPTSGSTNNFDVPWFGQGLLYIEGSKAYLIDNYEWDCYAEIELYQPIDSPSRFVFILTNICTLIEYGFEQGRIQGMNEKLQEIHAVLKPCAT